MIHPDSRSLEWIKQVATENKLSDYTLVEKTIRAFSLLEALAKSGCPFIFKGGTSLMLHLNSTKRLSIDIDIICPPGTDIEQYLTMCSAEYGFSNVQLVDRIMRTNVPKKHAKFYYHVSYYAGHEEGKILLDVLFEENHYSKVVSLPIQSRFLKTEGTPITVKVPSHEDLLADKLTAFAPHTTGIPFFKGERNCSMEINKQLFDIASLFDITNDLTTTASTFRRFALVELQYRNLQTKTAQSVLDDIYSTALCLTLDNGINKEEYTLLIDGMKRVRSFIHSEKYSLDKAIVNAAKAAYLSRLISNGITHVKHYDVNNISELANATISTPLPTKLNRLKRQNVEAFFYWNEIQKISKS